MKITDKLPITLLNILNEFNESLHPIKKAIELKVVTGKTTIARTGYETITIFYIVKNTRYNFRIEFVSQGDIISWQFYPLNPNSSKSYASGQKGAETASYEFLQKNFKRWRNTIDDILKMPDPAEYFERDDIIDSYSEEISELFLISESDKKKPFPMVKQEIIQRSLDEQLVFLDQEIEIESDVNSEKTSDLKKAKTILLELKEELPRSTAAEVKRKWSFSLAAIMKWCGDRFIAFIKLDSSKKHDISRTIGSFIGGILGIPKMDQ